MNKKNRYIGLIVLTIVCASFLNWKYCCNATLENIPAIVEKNKPIITPTKKSTNGISIIDHDGGFSFTHSDHINFNPSNETIITPVSENVVIGIEKLRRYLSKHPNKIVSITGFYKKEESYTGALPDLGIARATMVKNYLVDKNISSKQIDIYSKSKEELEIENDIYKSPLSFEIKTSATNSKDELDELRTTIQSNPLVLYFNTGESNINLSTAQRQKIALISKYLDKATDKSAILVGHTDSVGTIENNTALGQQRAEFAKEYLIRNGIASDKIIAKSKGPLEPIATNDTKEGRAKNRRTVITVN